MKINNILKSILFGTILLTGCKGMGNDNLSNSGATKVIRFYAFGGTEEKRSLRTLVEMYNAQADDIRVDLTLSGNADDHTTKMNILLGQSSTPPDVFYAGDGEFGTWLAKDIIANIQPLIEKDNFDIDDFYPSAIDRFRFDSHLLGQGDLYGLPSITTPHLTFFNVELFNSAGIIIDKSLEEALIIDEEVSGKITKARINNEIPLTWTEQRRLAEALTKKSGTFITQYGITSGNWFNYGWSNGGNIVSEDRTTFTMDDPKLREPMEFFIGLSASGTNQVAPRPNVLSDSGSDKLFVGRQVAMMTAGSYLIGPMRQQAGFLWDVMPLAVSPHAVETYISEGLSEREARNKARAGHSGGVALSISKNSRQIDSAWDFVKFMLGAEAQKKLTSDGIGTPSRKSLASFDVTNNVGKKPETIKLFTEATEYAKAGDWTYYPDRQWIELWATKFNSDVLQGNMTFDQLINETSGPTQAKIDEYRARFGF